MKVELLYATPSQLCADAAAVCHDKEPTLGLLQNVVKLGHESIMEFQDFTFRVDNVSRALTHQLVRHRIASFAQQSQRHVKIDGLYWYYVPESVCKHPDPSVLKQYTKFMDRIRGFNKYLLLSGIPLEDARYVLPNATYSSIVLKFNARSLQNFFTLRCCDKAQTEIRTLAKIMLAISKQTSPHLFRGDYPNCTICKHPCVKE